MYPVGGNLVKIGTLVPMLHNIAVYCDKKVTSIYYNPARITCY